MSAEETKEIVTYPCRWLFKVIGPDADLLVCAIEEITGGYASLSPSHTSSSGRYISYNLEVEVSSRQERDGLYADFQAHPDVVFIL